MCGAGTISVLVNLHTTVNRMNRRLSCKALTAKWASVLHVEVCKPLNHTTHLRTLVLIALAVAVAGCGERATTTLPPSNIRSDEEILFFPTYGLLAEATGQWRLDVHGQVFEPENSSTRRAALIAVLRASADVGADDEAFREDRIRPFLVDNERGKSVTIEVAGEQFDAGTSGANGHFSGAFAMTADSLRLPAGTSRIQDFKAILRVGDLRAFTGRVHLIAPRGVSIVSDIDDTIKHSQVTDKSELLKNTFLREFRAVEGMPELYSRLADSDVAFHYVSGSPWQLYGPIDAFLSAAGFPQGTFHLKHFRLKDSSALELLSSQQETKLAAITPLLHAFPERRFILIGDSGEQDPEIYGRIARQHADQIIGIFIRNVTGEASDAARFERAFRHVPRERWTVFDDVSEISESVLDRVNLSEKG